MVLVIGFEPIRPRGREILSLLRLPVSPYQRIFVKFSLESVKKMLLSFCHVCRFRHTRIFIHRYSVVMQCKGQVSCICLFRQTGAFLWDFRLAACGGLRGPLPRRRRFFCAPLSIFFPCAAADFSACRCRFFGVPLPIFFPCTADLSFARRLFAEDRASVGVHSLPRRRRAFFGAAGERKRPPLHAKRRPIFWRRHPDLNRGVRALQALALPLGYSAKNKVRN